MPGIPDTSLPNRHSLFVATSGGGKSSAVKAILESQNPHRVVFWDPDGEYTARIRARSAGEFAKQLARATKSGKRYRIALECRPTVKNFERFCAAVWAVACSTRPMVVVVEELSDVTPSAGKASQAWGEVIRRSRKFAVTLLCVTQSPTEISKTVYRNVKYKWAGIVETEAERGRMAKELDVSRRAISELSPLHFYQKATGEPARQGHIKFSRGKPTLYFSA